jgi:hypothetical protein
VTGQRRVECSSSSFVLLGGNGEKEIRRYDLEAGKAGVLRALCRPGQELWKYLGLGLCHSCKRPNAIKQTNMHTPHFGDTYTA